MRLGFTCTQGICLVIAHLAGAQAPNTSNMLTGSKPGQLGASGLASNSPWVKLGAQLGYKITGNGNFENDFLVSARTELNMIDVGQPDGLKIPLIGNLSALTSDLAPSALQQKTQEFINSAQGINLSLQPYYVVGYQQRLQTTLYGSAGWKINAAKAFADTSKTVYVNQARLSAGIAFDAWILRKNTTEGNDTTQKIDTHPVTFSIEPAYTIINGRDYLKAFGKAKPDDITSLELTAIVPVSGVGLLVQTAVANHMSPLTRIGIIYVKPGTSNASSDPSAANRTPPASNSPPPKPNTQTPSTPPPAQH